MCVYCFVGDSWFRRDPPWNPWKDFQDTQVDPYPTVPKPLVPVVPWDIDKLKEYLEVLKQIKELEDKVGCPCEPNKADYIGMFKKRIEELEKKIKAKKKRSK